MKSPVSKKRDPAASLAKRIALLARRIQSEPWNAPGTDKTNVIRSAWWSLRLLRSVQHVDR